MRKLSLFFLYGLFPVTLIVLLSAGAYGQTQLPTPSSPPGLEFNAQTEDPLFLETPEAVAAEYCRIDAYDEIRKSCGGKGIQKMILIPLPRTFGDQVIQHMNEAKARDFYGRLHRDDLFHGHLIPRGPETAYNSTQDYFADSSAVLYHSDETANRWLEDARKGLVADQRRARSYVGWKDGSIERAIDIITRSPHGPIRLNVYENVGTIYTDDIVKAVPELSHHTKHLEMSVMKKFSVKACRGGDCRTCYPAGQFSIVEHATGRFVTAEGTPVELYLRCLY